MKYFSILIALLALDVSSAPATRSNATLPGELTADPPSLYCAAFRWKIEGDANYNCSAKMEFRKKGTGAWLPAYPPSRVIFPPAGTDLDGKVRGWWKDRPYPNLVAGSLFNLDPATTYDVKLSLSDPDGGKAEKMVTVTTRDWPRDPLKCTDVQVNPQTIAKLPPLITAGTRVTLAPGEYGQLRINGNGTPSAPVIIQGASLKDVRVNGPLEVRGSHIWLRNLTVKSSRGPAIRPIEVQFPIVSGCDVTVEKGGSYGIYLDKCPGGFVFDNTVRGPCAWPRSAGIEDEHGIQTSGDHIIVMHNRVSGFGDGISIVNYVEHNNFEVAYNDVSECTDDGIQVEFTTQNARVYRNRWIDVYNVLSAAPVWGGPAYLVQNEMYNCHWPIKVMRSPSGVNIFNNSSFAWEIGMYSASEERWFNVKLRNNLFLGSSRKCFETTVGNYFVDVDYNGWGLPKGAEMSAFGKWEGKNYPSLAALQAERLFKNSIEITPEQAWVKAPPPNQNAKNAPGLVDLSLKPGCAAIDRGEPIPNIIGAWSGKAPDLGAREWGSKAPPYGPRIQPPRGARPSQFSK